MKRLSILIVLLLILLGVYWYLDNREKQTAPVPAKHDPAKVETPAGEETNKNAGNEQTENNNSADKQQQAGKQEEKTSGTTPQKPKVVTFLWKTVEDTAVVLTLKLPENFEPAGIPYRALDAKGKLLNVESRYLDKATGNEVDIKFYPEPNADKIYAYLEKQYKAGAGFFKNGRKKIRIAGHEALYGVSVRRFDGKGHRLNPPAKVIVLARKDPHRQGMYEIFLRAAKGDAKTMKMFEQVIKSIR